jgi:hypothetical protein
MRQVNLSSPDIFLFSFLSAVIGVWSQGLVLKVGALPLWATLPALSSDILSQPKKAYTHTWIRCFYVHYLYLISTTILWVIGAWFNERFYSL